MWVTTREFVTFAINPVTPRPTAAPATHSGLRARSTDLLRPHQLRLELLLELQAWREACAAALLAWRSRKRDVVLGTHKMRQLYRCRVGEVPLLTG